jgi:hypothetical protein
VGLCQARARPRPEDRQPPAPIAPMPPPHVVT